jgi:hypothetical protein
LILALHGQDDDRHLSPLAQTLAHLYAINIREAEVLKVRNGIHIYKHSVQACDECSGSYISASGRRSSSVSAADVFPIPNGPLSQISTAQNRN